MLQQVLAQQSALDQGLADCTHPQLKALLGDLQRRKGAQASRLLQWLYRPAPEPVSAADKSPETPVNPPPPSATKSSGDTATVIERQDLTDSLIIFKLSRPAGFIFTPGQSVALELAGLDRRYSLVSAPHEPFLEFFVELNPGGAMSQRLRALVPGDLIQVGTPKGRLQLQEDYTRHLMIATVTGVNPFVSILRDYLHQGRSGDHFLLLHGASYADEFGYRGELEALAGTHPEVLNYIPTVSRPEDSRNTAWRGARGRVGEQVETLLSQAGLDPGSTAVYACGNPDMVDAIVKTYKPKGFVIQTERYD